MEIQILTPNYLCIQWWFIFPVEMILTSFFNFFLGRIQTRDFRGDSLFQLRITCWVRYPSLFLYRNFFFKLNNIFYLNQCIPNSVILTYIQYEIYSIFKKYWNILYSFIFTKSLKFSVHCVFTAHLIWSPIFSLWMPWPVFRFHSSYVERISDHI